MVDVLPAQQRTGDEHWYRGTADAIYQNLDILQTRSTRHDYVVVLAGDHIYKMDYSVMLMDHVNSGRACTVGCIEVPRMEATAFGVMAVNEDRSITDFLEKPADPPAMPGKPDIALASMGIYVFDAAYLYQLLEEDNANPASSHDFGKDVIPRAVAQGRAQAHPFSLSCVTRGARGPHAPVYWRDVGTIDAFWAANLDLASITPELDIYDTDWPIWTYQRQLPPAKFVLDIDGNHGMTVNTIVSGGCIVSGSQVKDSVLFSNVRIHSFCEVKEAVLLPDVEVGRGARLSKVVVDRGCVIPAGMVVGEDAAADAARFERTDTGVVLVTRDMLQRLETPTP
jgi:glucose-1-phosphate adenylyltransferase